jgi:radical SAM protein with 4Fe4S-binding SPASM domain
MTDSDRQFGGDKMFVHADRIAAWQQHQRGEGALPAPVTVELDLTNLCNHACPGCTFSYLVNVSQDSIPFDLALAIVDQLAAIGVRAVTFSGGGEPLVYGEARVLALVERCRQRGMDAALITNGSLLTDPRWAELCTWVRVSLDGYDAATFARFHGRSEREFAKVIERLRAVAAVRPRSATIGAGFLTDAGSIERGDFWRMAEFCASIDGLDYLQFRPLVVNMVADPTLSGGNAALSLEEFQAIQGAFREAAEAFSRRDFRVLSSVGKYHALAEPGFGRSYERCLAHFLEAVISADAKVYLCCHTQGQERFCLGDLREQTFAEIWHGERARQVYDSFDPRSTCPPACRLHLQNQMLQELSRGVHPNFI